MAMIGTPLRAEQYSHRMVSIRPFPHANLSRIASLKLISKDMIREECVKIRVSVPQSHTQEKTHHCIITDVGSD